MFGTAGSGPDPTATVVWWEQTRLVGFRFQVKRRYAEAHQQKIKDAVNTQIFWTVPAKFPENPKQPLTRDKSLSQADAIAL